MNGVLLYPYGVAESLTLRLSEFEEQAHGRRIAVIALEGDDPLLRLPAVYDASGDTDWDALSFLLTATLSEDSYERILPPTSDIDVDTALYVRATCATTRYRHSLRLQRTGAGCWEGAATVHRLDLQGSLILRPQLIRTTSIPGSPEGPHAAHAGAVIAFGTDVSLHIDPPPALALRTGAVTMFWEDFSNSQDAWRRGHPDDVYHLEPYHHEPRLWLNSRHSLLRDLLDSTAKRGTEAVLRDLVAMQIAQPVMLQLCTATVASVEIDDDSGGCSAPTGWRSTMFDLISPALYPEDTTRESRLRRAAYEFRDPDGAASLVARLGTVVQEMLSSYKAAEAAARNFEAARDREDVGNG
jgi:hypothetical protein